MASMHRMPTAMNTDSITRAVTKPSGARFVLALVDRVGHHGGPDVRDDEDELEQRPRTR